MKLLFKLFRKQILAAYEKTTKPNMVFAFVDSEGQKYYVHAQDSEMSVERLKWLKGFLAWLIEGVTYGELGDLLQIGQTANAKVITALSNEDKKLAAKEAARVNSVLEEIKRRREMVFNHDLLLQYLAVIYIREDETPDVFSPDIQDQKVKQFEKETTLNSSFFFGRPELRNLTHLYTMSQQEFISSWAESLVRKMQNKQVLEILRS